MTSAIGFRVKSGWAAAVLITGPVTSPRILDCRRIALSDPDVPHSRQPYHAGFGTAQTDTRAVEQLIAGVTQFTRRAIAALLGAYRESRPRRAGVVVSSLTDPATIGNQHMRAHASEGQLFRAVVEQALERSDVKTVVVLEREIYERLGKALHRPPATAKTAVAALGAETKPWRAEQKVAAAVAWLMLMR